MPAYKRGLWATVHNANLARRTTRRASWVKKAPLNGAVLSGSFLTCSFQTGAMTALSVLFPVWGQHSSVEHRRLVSKSGRGKRIKGGSLGKVTHTALLEKTKWKPLLFPAATQCHVHTSLER